MTARIRVGALMGYGDLVSSLGGDAGVLASRSGLSLEILGDEDALIHLHQLVHLLEDSATSLQVSDFGLRLGASQDVRTLGPLAVAMQNASTVEEALRCTSNYMFMHSSALKLELEEQGDVTCLRTQINLDDVPHSSMRQALDQTAGLAHQLFKLLAGQNYSLLSVGLPYGPEAENLKAVYEEYFGAEIAFGCKDLVAYLPTSTLKRKLAGSNELLHRMATGFLDVQYPSPDDRVSARVEKAVRRTLGTDSCSRNAVARAMAMHPRTLYRHLEKEGQTFEKIRDRVRQERVECYLTRTNMPLSQIAGVVGFSEQAVLTRACRRWFGLRPLEYRKNHASLLNTPKA